MGSKGKVYLSRTLKAGSSSRRRQQQRAAVADDGSRSISSGNIDQVMLEAMGYITQRSLESSLPCTFEQKEGESHEAESPERDKLENRILGKTSRVEICFGCSVS